jgi:hypothetical protein
MTIREAAPEAEETISYPMPTVTLKGKGKTWKEPKPKGRRNRQVWQATRAHRKAYTQRLDCPSPTSRCLQ